MHVSIALHNFSCKKYYKNCNHTKTGKIKVAIEFKGHSIYNYHNGGELVNKATYIPTCSYSCN